MIRTLLAIALMLATIGTLTAAGVHQPWWASVLIGLGAYATAALLLAAPARAHRVQHSHREWSTRH